jgi:hypothetical protein
MTGVGPEVVAISSQGGQSKPTTLANFASVDRTNPSTAGQRHVSVFEIQTKKSDNFCSSMIGARKISPKVQSQWRAAPGITAF